MKKIIRKTSVFPASRETIFLLLQRLETLQYIAKPYATFENIDGGNNLIWEPGGAFAFRLKMFGIIPLGTHTIRVREFCVDTIYTSEGNPFCPVWNHRIELLENRRNYTTYTDEVEIDAGWKTPFVCLWAKAFYGHRQKKWLKLLKKEVGLM